MFGKSLIIGLLIGLLGGFVLSKLIVDGYVAKWQAMPALPIEAAQFEGVEGSMVFVRASDGSVYSCNRYLGDCWQPATFPSADNTHFTIPRIVNDCQFGLAFWNAQPSTSKRACMQGTVGYVDGYSKVGYILDEQNRVWEWSHIVTARFEYNFPPFAIIAGGIVGGIVGAVVYGVRRLLSRKTPQLGVA